MNIPDLSKRFFDPQALMRALPIMQPFLTMFAVEDRTANRKDPSKCAWIAKFPGGAIGWMAKLAIDADGKADGPAYRPGSRLDRDDGQDATSLRFADGSSLTSEGVPYYVLPGEPFGQTSGLQLGDIGILIYRDKLTAVIIGDIGPRRKIGEASIKSHENLRPAAPDPCSERDGVGRCYRVRNASIEQEVLAIFFPNSAIKLTNAETAQAEIDAKAFALWKACGGLIPEPQALSASKGVAS